MEDDVHARRPDLVRERRNAQKQGENQRSNVSDAHRLSQSTPLSFGALTM